MRRLLIATILLSLAAACGRSTPAGPSALSAGTPGSGTSGPGTSVAGATINGAVVDSGSSGGATFASAGRIPLAAPTSSSMTVSVPGTGISVQIGQGGTFTLEGVPAGSTELEFTAPGFSAHVSLGSVGDQDTINITVSVSGSSVVLESEQRRQGDQEQLEGRVESLPPTVPDGTLVVAGETVTTDVNTVFLLDGAPADFSALAIGQRVHVSGTRSGDSLAATEIDIQNTNTDLPVDINGVVQDFSGTDTDFQFTIDGRLIKGDDQTEFFGNSVFADLVDGVQAEVKGLQRDGYVYASRIHVSTPDTGGDQQDSASIEGPLTSMTGTAPDLTLVVDGTTVTTTATTEVRRRGDVQTLDVLDLGMTLHVVGTRQTDGSLVARQIQIKDDASGGQFEISGALGGLNGICPAVRFTVNGYTVTTDDTTTFDPGCSELKSGTKVDVKGVVQANGSVLATSVERNQ